MGGSVRVESEGEGHGTLFVIQLSAFSQVKQSDLKFQIEENILN
jgi:signal transduction histidine kinase